MTVPASAPGEPDPTLDSIDRVARRARRLIYGAAGGLMAIGLLSLGLGIDAWPTSIGALWQALRDTPTDSGALLIVAPPIAFVGTALFLRRSRRLATGEARRLARGHLGIAAMALLYALGLALGGWQQATSTRLDFQQERLAQQVAVARLKARQIDDWAHERMMNLRFLGSSLRAMPLDDANTSPEIRQLIELTLAQFLAANPERIAVGLFLPDGRPLVSAGYFPATQAEDLARQVAAAARGRDVSAGPVVAGGAGPRGLSIPFFAPIDATPPGKPVEKLVVMSLIDPTLGVLKGFGDWPTPSQSSELELIYRAGDEVVHIVPGREFEAAAPLSLRNAVQNGQLVGAQAVQTGQAVWDATDHHGQRVLAASYRTSVFPWIVVAKTDYREAMQPLEWETRKLWTMIWALVLLGGLFALALGAQLTMADALQRLRSRSV